MTSERRSELLKSLEPTRKLILWKKEVSSKEFAEESVYLPKSNAIGAGQRVDFRYSPHLLKPMTAFDDSYVQEIWLMFASQMAKTLFLFICWGKTIKFNPKSVMWMISKEAMIPRYQKEKIMDLVKASRELNTIVKDGLEQQQKSRSKTGELHHQGTSTYLIGAKTDDDKKSVTTKLVVVDEADEMEGIETISPLWERAKTHLETGAKLLVASTKKKKQGTITQGFNTCEQKNYLGMECPHCKELVEINPRDFIIMSEEDYVHEFNIDEMTEEIISEQYIPYASKNAFLKCPGCKSKITNEQKKKQIQEFKIDWIVKGVKTKARRVGFSANSILSFFVPFESMATEYLKAKTIKDENKRNSALEKFYEGYYNEAYETLEKSSSADDLLLLSNNLKTRELPQDTLRVYLTVDTQKDHFWYTLTAFIYGANCHIIDYGRVEEFYDIEELYIQSQYLSDKNGNGIMASNVAIDARGYNQNGVNRTKEVKLFVTEMTKKYGEDTFYCAFGSQKLPANQEYIIKRIKDDSEEMQEIKALHHSNTEMKNTVSASFQKSIKKAKGQYVDYEDEGLFYINQDAIEKNSGETVSTSLIRQLTAEVYDYAVKSNGKKELEKSWFPVPSKADNHLWDCVELAYTLAHKDKVAMAKKPDNTTVDNMLDAVTWG